VGAAIYSRRKTVVEPVFGQIKQARGFRQFLLRGLEKVQGEWAVICLTHNILKLHRKRLTNTPVRQAGSVLKCPDDRKNRVVSAQATYTSGGSAVGG